MAARDRLDALISGYRASQVIRAAAVHDVAGVLAHGPLPADEIAARTGCHPSSMHRLLRCLAALGICDETADGTFANTELGTLLRADVAGNLRGAATNRGQESWWSAWGQLPATIKDGQVAYERTQGRTMWADLDLDPEAATRFNDFMADKTSAFLPELLAAFDFGPAATIVDIGGGRGALLGGILSAYPTAAGVVFDQPGALTETAAYLADVGVADRCSLRPGDFFDAVPAGGDVYIVRQILHDWPDDRARQILDVCHRAMAPGATLLVIDQVLPERAHDTVEDRIHFEADLHMMVLFGSRERTFAELESLLGQAGFDVRATLATKPESTIVAVA